MSKNHFVAKYFQFTEHSWIQFQKMGKFEKKIATSD